MPGIITKETGNLTVEAMHKAGINFVSVLPDIQHTSIQEGVEKRPEDFIIHYASNESIGYAACCGAWLGGRKAALVVTTAGLNNMCWPMLAFQNFDFPLVLMIPYRGDIGESTWFMRKYVHEIEPLLQLFKVSYKVVRRNEEIEQAVTDACATSFNLYVPTAILFSGGVMR